MGDLKKGIVCKITLWEGRKRWNCHEPSGACLIFISDFSLLLFVSLSGLLTFTSYSHWAIPSMPCNYKECRAEQNQDSALNPKLPCPTPAVVCFCCIKEHNILIVKPLHFILTPFFFQRHCNHFVDHIKMQSVSLKKRSFKISQHNCH